MTTTKTVKKTDTKLLTKAQFNRLGKARQKILIAQDVLDQLKKKRFIANTGHYVIFWGLKNGACYTDDVQQHFEDIEFCEVCALGACLLSATHFKNKLTFSDADIMSLRAAGHEKATNTFSLLLEVFSPEEILLIEHCFEGYSTASDADRVGQSLFGADDNYSQEQLKQVNTFYSHYRSDDSRLRAIMNNIIENKGKFILP